MGELSYLYDTWLTSVCVCVCANATLVISSKDFLSAEVN